MKALNLVTLITIIAITPALAGDDLAVSNYKKSTGELKSKIMTDNELSSVIAGNSIFIPKSYDTIFPKWSDQGDTRGCSAINAYGVSTSSQC